MQKRIKPLNEAAKNILREHENNAAKEYMNVGPEQKERLKHLYNFMCLRPSQVNDGIYNMQHRLIEIIGTSFPNGYGHAADYLHAVNWLSWPTNGLRA